MSPSTTGNSCLFTRAALSVSNRFKTRLRIRECFYKSVRLSFVPSLDLSWRGDNNSAMVTFDSRIAATPDFLRERATFVRLETIRLIEIAKVGHYSSVFSAAEIFATLYYSAMSIKPGDPSWPDRDRFLMGKGHAGSARAEDPVITIERTRSGRFAATRKPTSPPMDDDKK